VDEDPFDAQLAAEALHMWMMTEDRALVEPANDAADGQPVERTSWWPRDLGPIVAGNEDTPPPTHLARDDGHRLWYAGKINALIGESESGKTWVALLAVKQALDVAEHVTIIDFEDTAPGIVSRLRAVGCSDARLAHLQYIGPEEALGLAAQQDLAEALQDHAPSLVIVDGVNAAMTLLGLDLLNNKDATLFSHKLLRPIARTGACVGCNDHVPKNADARGKGGIGAQAKRADVTGCSLTVEVVREFGRGLAGELKLTVDKDRPGHVRAHSVSAKLAGHVYLESTADGTGVDVRIEAASERSPGESLPSILERLSRQIETAPGRAKGPVIAAVGIGRTEGWDALGRLERDGFIRTVSKGNAELCFPVKPYREGELWT
jgi:AAA domain